MNNLKIGMENERECFNQRPHSFLKFEIRLYNFSLLYSGGPGFPRGRSQPQREFVKKMHENEKIWTEWGRNSSALSLDPPLFWSVMVALIH